MTQIEFILNFKRLCEKYEITGVCLTDLEYTPQMCYVNYQDNEIVNDWVSLVGFDDDGDFYIDFLDTDCTAYEEDMEYCNCEDAWDILWNAVATYLDSDAFDTAHDIEVGDSVYWIDPAINDYPEEEREDVLKRRFVVFKVSGNVIHISDTYTTAEVYADELVRIV